MKHKLKGKRTPNFSDVLSEIKDKAFSIEVYNSLEEAPFDLVDDSELRDEGKFWNYQASRIVTIVGFFLFILGLGMKSKELKVPPRRMPKQRKKGPRKAA